MKRSLIRSSINSALSAAHIATGIPAASVFIESLYDGLWAAEETILNTPNSGATIAIQPIWRTTVTGHFSGRVSQDAEVEIHLRTNPQNTPSGFSADDCIDAITTAILTDGTLNGIVPKVGHNSDNSGAFTQLVKNDRGLLTYAILFSIPTSN